VHLQILSWRILAVRQRVHGVICVDAFIDVPFVLAQTLVILRVNDGVFAACQRNPAKGIAIANPPI
jgi:hypothetical protein